jgi:sugar O-acyltransferase (sialic acid O-acetyltransferase NeuD family)
VSVPQLLARVVAPLVNTNEPEARVVEIGVEPFGRVSAGQVICVLETSKSTMEVESEHEGWVGELHVALFDDVSAGSLICEVYDAEPPREPAASGPSAGAAAPRLTRKAEAVAREAGVDLSLLPTDRFVTEQDVRDLIEMLSAAEDLEALCVVDDGLPAGERVLGVPVAGGRGTLAALAAAGLGRAVNGIGAIGRPRARMEIHRMLEDHGLALPVLVHPGALVSPSAGVGDGAQVHAGAVVSSRAEVGRGVIVNSGAIVSHDCRVADHVHLAPGSVLAGDVHVGEGALVGMGATVALGLAIGARALVGNGAVVTADVPDDAIVPAGTVWPGPAD